MNKERLLALADDLAAPVAEHRKKKFIFDMATYIGPEMYTSIEDDFCGTAGCIAGYAALKFGAEEHQTVINRAFRSRHGEDHYIRRQAEKLLDLTQDQAVDLFEPSNVLLQRVTAKQAAGVIRRFVKTGKINWGYVRRKQRADERAPYA